MKNFEHFVTKLFETPTTHITILKNDDDYLFFEWYATDKYTEEISLNHIYRGIIIKKLNKLYGWCLTNYDTNDTIFHTDVNIYKEYLDWEVFGFIKMNILSENINYIVNKLIISSL